jgi:hypothetical protein
LNFFFNECKSLLFGTAGMCFSSPLGPMGAFLLDFHPTDFKMASWRSLAFWLIGRVAI